MSRTLRPEQELRLNLYVGQRLGNRCSLPGVTCLCMCGSGGGMGVCVPVCVPQNILCLNKLINNKL